MYMYVCMYLCMYGIIMLVWYMVDDRIGDKMGQCFRQQYSSPPPRRRRRLAQYSTSMYVDHAAQIVYSFFCNAATAQLST